jgi:hypothetical protein
MTTLVPFWELRWVKSGHDLDRQIGVDGLPGYTMARLERLVNEAYQQGRKDGYGEGQQPFRRFISEYRDEHEQYSDKGSKLGGILQSIPVEPPK